MTKFHPKLLASCGRSTVRSLWRGDFLVNCINFFFLASNKLLPKPQRRGAIVILGMLALAKHNILSELDHVDTMLKVGLGALGRVSTAIISSLNYSNVFL